MWPRQQGAEKHTRLFRLGVVGVPAASRISLLMIASLRFIVHARMVIVHDGTFVKAEL